MKKLRLEFDELRVESFATADTADERGTVNAHFSTRCETAGYTCDGARTCGLAATCYVSCCAGSCSFHPDDPTFYASNCNTCAITYCVEMC
jgi:hypothetical protein